MQFHISCFVVILNGLFSWLLFSVPILANEDPVLVAPGKLKKTLRLWKLARSTIRGWARCVNFSRSRCLFCLSFSVNEQMIRRCLFSSYFWLSLDCPWVHFIHLQWKASSNISSLKIKTWISWYWSRHLYVLEHLSSRHSWRKYEIKEAR